MVHRLVSLTPHQHMVPPFDVDRIGVATPAGVDRLGHRIWLAPGGRVFHGEALPAGAPGAPEVGITPIPILTPKPSGEHRSKPRSEGAPALWPTLVKDDVKDQDDLRRGKASFLKRFGVDFALLLPDILIPQAQVCWQT